MVFSELLLKIPYSIAWRLINSAPYSFPVVFYCTDYLDYLVFEPIKRHLPEMTIVSKNRRVQNILFDKGISSILYPAYPKVVIMARHSLHMFPSKKILKIGMRHGPYNFKSFIDSKKYNIFDLFLFTSETELQNAINHGIKNGVAAGYPKIDDLHNGKHSIESIDELRKSLQFDNEKKVILFSATWNKSGLSALEQWYDKLDALREHYNILVTIHPFSEQKYADAIRNTAGIYFIENENLNRYLLLADLLISDTSSIIGEYCSLDKPIITFKIKETGRLNPDIVNALERISFRVDDFNDLVKTLPKALENSMEQSRDRKLFNNTLFSNLDGNAGKKSAMIIEEFLINHGISF